MKNAKRNIRRIFRYNIIIRQFFSNGFRRVNR
nr:MAG TPA: hypothetical protein [Caudoviricetes sp.]